MNLTVSWPRSDHILLERAKVEVEEDGRPGLPPLIDQVQEGKVVTAKASTFVGTDDVPPQTTRIRIEFRSPLVPGKPVLQIDQTFRGRDAHEHTVPSPGGPLVVKGLHPLLTPTINAGHWNIEVDTRLVDVTAAVGTLEPGLGRDLVSPSNGSSVRVLARTDSTRQPFWITCTPQRCRGATDTDLLGFLIPPQNSPRADLVGQLKAAVDAQSGGTHSHLSERRMVYLGQGFHPATTPATSDVKQFDHFSAGPGFMNVVIARGWEKALVDSGRHVAMVLPLPASGRHPAAATAALPSLLRQVYNQLRSAGDITPPADGALGAPRIGLASHSLGGSSAFAVVRSLGRRRDALSDIFLFEPNEISKNLDLLKKTSARICLVGFAHGSAPGPFTTLSRHSGVDVRLLPVGYSSAAERRDLVLIESRSPSLDKERNPRSLGHALDAIRAVWKPEALVAGHKHLTFRSAMLHNYIVQGGDDEGTGGPETHFLTQALKGSTFR